MATKKKGLQRVPSAGSPGERLAIVVTLKESTEWNAWVDELAGQCRTDIAKLIDVAFV
jgi:hypothetical protein